MSGSCLVSKEAGYHAVSLNDEDEMMVLGPKGEHAPKRSARFGIWTYTLVSCNIFLFVFSVVLIAVADQRQCGRTGRNRLLKAVNSYSPLLDAVDIPLSTAVINVSALEVMRSVYTGLPNRDMDAAWDLLGNLDPVAITADEVIALGKNPSTAARWPDRFGLGPDAYIAAPNAMHNIHCLDWIRRDLDFDHYYGGKFPEDKPPVLHRFHTEHCLYVLLKQLTCRPSTEMVVFEWVEGNKSPLPDFNVQETCLNFDAMLDWHNASSRPRRDMLALRAPEGQRRVPMSDDIKKVMELTGKSSEHHL
ncbi:tat pathway signal sequence protein [Colletotrichum incanum]|uniref:Tat pathway signal sequence protein n=1 Tax=Colletotrichum incanum TaxID=1573173 RepID=A0A161W9Y9_COLIC|nr:tat pathway signal sequence protein [Colletotrichum incanum]